ncbi:hypothetical protein FHU38_001045 [Saccharomonospora amisosensis]|uniref:SAV-6107-like HEPN domain-containing protein n=1 Tax=Saccharomonospora amisosensis TaxID=1128677 RepID=A0A7X5UME4_9PSEU|nr:hypothetical protein [Saccharomonospora amisosensis]NIJ10701.1 hypothetical protein [Saccharomonospora amisosensis]
MQSCAFLPLTTEVATRLCREALGENARGRATTVRRRAAEAEAAAARCWTALLAGCDSAVRWELTPRLRELSEATSLYAGSRWWLTDGAVHRRRVANAQSDIEDAIADADGQEFARAFVGYDHAMARAVVCANNRVGRPAESVRRTR